MVARALPSARPSRQQPAGVFGKALPGKLLDWLVAIDTRHRQRADLAALDDHLLKDIGVTRAEVERALRRL